MREILFRAWDKDKNLMASVIGISFGHDGSNLRITVPLYPKSECYYCLDGENGVLMQYTGMKDVAGKKIFEGDILGMENATAKVVFWERPPEFGLDFSHNEHEWCEDWNLNDDGCIMEIIGNIWEHSELLGAKQA